MEGGGVHQDTVGLQKARAVSKIKLPAVFQSRSEILSPSATSTVFTWSFAEFLEYLSNRVEPDLFFCRISGRIIRYALPDIARKFGKILSDVGYPAGLIRHCRPNLPKNEFAMYRLLKRYIRKVKPKYII